MSLDSILREIIMTYHGEGRLSIGKGVSGRALDTEHGANLSSLDLVDILTISMGQKAGKRDPPPSHPSAFAPIAGP